MPLTSSLMSTIKTLSCANYDRFCFDPCLAPLLLIRCHDHWPLETMLPGLAPYLDAGVSVDRLCLFNQRSFSPGLVFLIGTLLSPSFASYVHEKLYRSKFRV